MAHAAFSPEWAQAYGERIKASEAYKKAAASWEWPLVLNLTADPSLGITEDAGVYLDLMHGECRDARLATDEDRQTAPYVLSADAYTWKQVMERKMEPISAMMRGKIKVTKGSIVTLARYVAAAKCLVDCATEVDTIFPEGL